MGAGAGPKTTGFHYYFIIISLCNLDLKLDFHVLPKNESRKLYASSHPGFFPLYPRFFQADCMQKAHHSCLLMSSCVCHCGQILG
jgi:hypothetical protein